MRATLETPVKTLRDPEKAAIDWDALGCKDDLPSFVNDFGYRGADELHRHDGSDSDPDEIATKCNFF